ncbi:MAG: desulfoferrodoxin [archaeon GB-1845-036]|nr:desulfoferrodoxin [Candidatus Culexmicrobium thermophilum]HDO19932.1 desulfoferrodoxin [Candidatus Bathyarchaeota archaeon]
MTNFKQIYKCMICGNIVEILHPGIGQLVCCNQPMKLLELKFKEQGLEKHVPVLERFKAGWKVKVGSVPHPMEEKHYIEWIELNANGESFKFFLKPGDKPEAIFNVEAENVWARIYCNIHGLWTSKST